MTPREIWKGICETEGLYVPLFQQYWWMETVCEGKHWDVLLAGEDNRIDGAMPFLYGRKFGLKYILQPQLTPWCGPWINPKVDADTRQRTLAALAAGLRNRKSALSLQCFPPEEADWQVFRACGFGHVVRHTYRFTSLSDVDALYRKASRLRRRYDKNVSAECVLDEHLPVDEFAPFHTGYYERKGHRDLIPESLLRRVVTTACGRCQGLLWGLRRRSDNALVAAWFVAYDERWAWSLLLAIAEDAPKGAMSYLIWQMLHRLSSLTQGFDFEGGMNPSLGFFYSSFGTEKTPYHCIYRTRIPFGKRILGV